MTRCSRCGNAPTFVGIQYGPNGRHCWPCARDLATRAPWKVAR